MDSSVAERSGQQQFKTRLEKNEKNKKKMLTSALLRDKIKHVAKESRDAECGRQKKYEKVLDKVKWL